MNINRKLKKIVKEVVKQELEKVAIELRKEHDVIYYSESAVIFNYKKVNNYKTFQQKSTIIENLLSPGRKYTIITTALN